MRLAIDPEVAERFPGLVVGVLTGEGLDNSGERPALDRLLAQREAALPERLGPGPLAEHPRIAPWRQAYRAFGAKPKKSPSSVESLCRRLLKGDAVPRIGPLVDAYNAVSLAHLLPAGGEDLDALVGDLRLTFAGEAEPPVLLLGDREPRPPHSGEVIYRDDVGAVCRRWNWREAHRTRLTPGTSRAVLVLEALPPAGRGEVEAALAELAGLVERFAGSWPAGAILDASRLEVGLPLQP